MTQARAIVHGATPACADLRPVEFFATLFSSIGGIPGGLFAPSLAVGAGMAANLHMLFHDVPLGALALVGMVSYLTGVVQTPITSFVIVSEMTENHTMIIPLMLAALIADAVSKSICKDSIYHALAGVFLKNAGETACARAGMSDADPDIPFDQTSPGAAERLVRLSPKVRRIIADNPGPMTFTGTCTYVVGDRRGGGHRPRPDSPAHLAALLESLGKERVRHILVTHTHRDHSAGAAALKAATGAQILGCAPYPAATGEDDAGADAAHDRSYRPDSNFTRGRRSSPGRTMRSKRSRPRAIPPTISPSHWRRKARCSPAIMSWPGRRPSSFRRTAGWATIWPRSKSSLAARTSHYWPGHGGGIATTAADGPRADPSSPPARSRHPRRTRQGAGTKSRRWSAASIAASIRASQARRASRFWRICRICPSAVWCTATALADRDAVYALK